MAQSSNKHSTPFPVTSVECCSIAPIGLPLWKPNAFSPPCACPFARRPVSNVHNQVKSISSPLYSALGCRTCFGWRVISEGDTSKVGQSVCALALSTFWFPCCYHMDKPWLS